MDVIVQIIAALGIGFVVGAIPGPILTAAFTEALRGGFFRSLRVAFKAMTIESLIAFFVLAVFFPINIPRIFSYAISIVGAAVLVSVALKVWKIKDIGSEGEIIPFWKMFLMIGGPVLIFWIAVCLPQAFLLKESVTGGQFIFLVLFESGWFLGTVAMLFIFTRFRKILVAKKLIAPAFKIFSLILFVFAAEMAAEAVIYLANNI